jgi:CRISPR-associated protein Csd2
MARKPNIPYGLYRVHGYYNPSLARRKKAVDGQREDKHEWVYFVRKPDMEAFWEALENMYEKHSASSAAAGEQATRGLWVFSHDTGKGNAHAHKLFELIDVPPCAEREEARAFQAYEKHMEFPFKEADLGEVKSLESLNFPGVSITRLV